MAAQRALRLAAVVAGRAARPHIGALTRHTVFFDQKCRVWPAARGQLAAAPYLPAAARAVPPALSAWQGLAHIAGWAATGSTAGGWASPAAARRWLAGPSGPGATDAYTVLGVARGLSDREYKVAYLKLAKTCHPDMNPGDKDATARFQVQPSLGNLSVGLGPVTETGPDRALTPPTGGGGGERAAYCVRMRNSLFLLPLQPLLLVTRHPPPSSPNPPPGGVGLVREGQGRSGACALRARALFPGIPRTHAAPAASRRGCAGPLGVGGVGGRDVGARERRRGRDG